MWLVVIAAVAWMVHSAPDSKRSIQRFRKARRSLAPQGRRHRAPASSTSETSTVVVMATQRRSRSHRVIDLRERDPEPRPARWPADGWSLGSVAPSGPRIAWATSGASPSRRTDAPVEVSGPARREVDRPSRPEVGRSAHPGAGRTSPRLTSSPSQLPPPPKSNVAARNQPRPEARLKAPDRKPEAPLKAPDRKRAAPRPQGAGPRGSAPARQPAPARQSAPVRQPATGRQAAPRPAPKPVAGEPVRRVSLDERRHTAAGQAGRPATPANGSGRWRVIDLTPEPKPKQRSIPAPPPARLPGGRREAEVQRWGLAAGAEAQGAPGPLPAVFRLDPLHARNEAGSRAR
ncbi:MAG TPA: hypothetical protein VG779_07920 [Actinomycetota bacterium]|nr:hypothetical protein [Actinomycetota bacterium]